MDVEQEQQQHTRSEQRVQYAIPFPHVLGLYAFMATSDNLVMYEVAGKILSEGRRTVVDVEAKKDERFTVNLLDNRIDKPDCASLWYLFVDGKRVNSYLTTPNHQLYQLESNDPGRVTRWIGREESESTARPFFFTPLETTIQLKDACQDSSIVEEVGSVKIQYHLVKNVRLRNSSANFQVEYGQDALFPAPKAKSVSLQVGFGDPENVSRYSVFDFDLVETVPQPFSEVVFRYRSKELLPQARWVPEPGNASPNIAQHARQSYAASVAGDGDQSPAQTGGYKSPFFSSPLHASMQNLELNPSRPRHSGSTVSGSSTTIRGQSIQYLSDEQFLAEFAFEFQRRGLTPPASLTSRQGSAAQSPFRRSDEPSSRLYSPYARSPLRRMDEEPAAGPSAPSQDSAVYRALRSQFVQTPTDAAMASTSGAGGVDRKGKGKQVEGRKR